MNRIHSTLVALVLGGAVTAGAYAAVHTVRLGQKAVVSTVFTHAVAARQAKLVAWHRALTAALAKRPPALPKLPHFAPVPAAPATPVAAAPASPPVTYVQPPPVVEYKHAVTKTTSSGTGGSDDGSGDSGGDNAGGGDN